MENDIPEESTEKELIRLVVKARQGCEESLQSIFQFFHEDIRKMIATRQIHSNDMEDAVQVCIICISKCVSKYRKRWDAQLGRVTPFTNYVRRSMWFDLRNGRGFSITNPWPVSNLENLNGHEPSYENESLSDALDAQVLLEGLPASAKFLVQSIFGIGQKEKTLQEIAALQGRPYNTPAQRHKVQSELTEALQQMKRKLE